MHTIPDSHAEPPAKPGYKKTKLGWIPEEWEVVKLKSLSIKIMVGIASAATHAYRESGIPMFRNQNIKEEGLDDSDLLFLEEGYEKIHKNKRLKEGDVLTVRTGYPGISATVPKEYEGAQCFTSLITRPNKQLIYSKWLAYFINSPIGKKIIFGIEAGGAQKNVNAGILSNMLVPKIPLHEQQKIAAILSTWDQAIALTRELIAAKEAQKKGLMQRLLTGKVRLKGFEGEWKKVKMGDIFKERKERGYENLELLSIGADGVYPQSESNKKDNSNSDKSKYKRICPGDIGYNTMRMWQGRSAVSKLEGIVSPAYTIVTPKKGIDVNFMGNLFQLPKSIHFFWRYSQGLVGDTLNCKFPSFALVKLSIPPTLEEQTAIAAILTKADEEIGLLREKLAALQAQKKGLMQQLLTGKIRVV